MAHAIVNTDNMAGTRQGVLLRSLKVFGGSGRTDADRIDIDNGNVVALKTLMDGERETFAAEAPALNTPLEDLVLVASVELMYSELKRNLDEFYNAKEDPQPLRGYHFIPDAIFSVTEEAFENASPAVGQIVEVGATTKLNNVATATSGSTKIGEIIDTWTTGTKTFYGVMVKTQ